MTLWARKSDFSAAFEQINGEWDVSIEERQDKIIFVIQLLNKTDIDIEKFIRSHAVEQMTGCGADKVELELSGQPSFEVYIDRSKVPEDYDE